MKITAVVGARPNFVKIAPIVAALGTIGSFRVRLVHTGQHYDEQMSRIFFNDLEIPAPDVHLGVGSGSHAVQTGEVMKAFETECHAAPGDLILVVGDVNSTMACTLVGAKLGIRVAHVEAGLRSFDRTMPEEVNRVVTDLLADHLFTTSRDANRNLIREGIPESRIHFVGNVMIDSLMGHLRKAARLDVAARFGTAAGSYAVVTLHRPSNVDVPETLERILDTIRRVTERVPVIFPVHPRTERRIRDFGFETLLGSRVRLVGPMGYLEFLNLTSNARLVLTDSGGLQEETTMLGIPCLTLRPNTERPVTVTEGTNEVVGTDTERIVEAVDRIVGGGWKEPGMPELWDGRASHRIASVLERIALTGDDPVRPLPR
jgi:UDP-N-acetylglucosamine 2-epimerase (non-hydrolysing)